MHRFDDIIIVSQKQFWTKLNYIHENPIRKCLVNNTVDWKWSSARFWLYDEKHSTLMKEWEMSSSELNLDKAIIGVSGEDA